MKTSNYKTAHFPMMKKLAMYISVIVVLCLSSLVDIKAQYSVSENTTTIEEPVINREIEPEPETKITIWQIMQSQNRLFQTVSNVFKALSDVNNSVVQNTK